MTPDTPGFSVGLSIRRRREDAGLSRSQLGALLDRSAGTIGRWERDQAEPAPDALEAVAAVFGIDPIELSPPGIYVREVDLAPDPTYLGSGERGENLRSVRVEGFRSRWPTQFSTVAFLYHGSVADAPRLVGSWSEFETEPVRDGRSPYLAAALHGYFANGGERCFLVPFEPGAGALRSLQDLDGVSTVCFPDLMSEEGGMSPDDALLVQRQMVEHCEARSDRVAILDAPPGMDPMQIREWRSDHAMFNTKAAALYWPWIICPEEDADGWSTPRAVPPSGHLAGVLARVEALHGANKPPANEPIAGAVGPSLVTAKGEREILNPVGINCLIAAPDGETRIFGDRTLSSNALWRYLHTARLACSIIHGIRLGTSWVVTERMPQARLRAQVEHDVTRFMAILWRAGAIYGATAGEAYSVRCDDSTDGSEPGSIALHVAASIWGPLPEKYRFSVVYRQAM